MASGSGEEKPGCSLKNLGLFIRRQSNYSIIIIIIIVNSE
jgi:hypothetical protein